MSTTQEPMKRPTLRVIPGGLADPRTRERQALVIDDLLSARRTPTGAGSSWGARLDRDEREYEERAFGGSRP